MKRKIKKSVIYTASVVRNLDTSFDSGRDQGDWATFLGATQEEAVTKAMHARSRWEAKMGVSYDIVVGTITHKLQLPSNYKLVSI